MSDAGHEWSPEHVVDEALARELVVSQFPHLRGASVRLLATGWDNTVHLVDGDDGVPWVFRFPRRTIALGGLEREVRCLPTLAPRLPLPVPVPELVGAPDERFPWPFWGGRLVPGTELAEHAGAERPAQALPAGWRVRCAAATGRMLAALHDVSPGSLPPGAGGPVLPVDPMGRADGSRRVPMARARLEALERRGIWTTTQPVDELLDEAERLSPPSGPLVVSHGDLHIRHVLVDDAGEASGVIDWGDLCLAGPSVDLSLAFAAFSGAARRALLTEHGALSHDDEVRARMLAVALSATLADYAAEEGRQPLLAEALRGLVRAVDQ